VNVAARPTIGVVQFHAVLGDVGRNLEEVERHVATLAGTADLVVFPELFTTGYHLEALDHAALAEPLTGSQVARLCAAARRGGVALVGAILERDGDSLYDTAVIIHASGEVVGAYRKSHLHPSETEVFDPGDELTVVDLDGGIRLGLAICFEHAFPEIFAELALAGANVVAIPSAVKDGFGYLMELRTRARAQDNQIFVAAANLGGYDGRTSWCGRSAIVNPRGELLAFAGATASSRLVAEIDLAQVDAERHQEPIFMHRRPEMYPRLRRAASEGVRP